MKYKVICETPMFSILYYNDNVMPYYNCKWDTTKSKLISLRHARTILKYSKKCYTDGLKFEIIIHSI